MPYAGLDAALLAGAIAALVAAALLPALASLVPAPDRLRFAAPRALAVIGALAALALGVRLLAGAAAPGLAWWPGWPGQPFTLAPDALSAPFLALLGVSAAVAFAAQPTEPSPGGRARLALHATFVLALLVALAADHALLFLLAWEGATLASAALVASDVRSTRARGAAFLYLALSHAGLASVAWALLTLSAHAHSFAFPALAEAWRALPPGEAARLAWALTAGFAVKLGLVPLHAWLPAAHPEAPAPVSATLSGAMVKAGLYGLLRFAWALPGAPPAHWGATLIVAGTITTVLGALYAAVESDAKRLLAWSTIKHAGLLALATGLAAMLAAAGRPDIAGLALAAALVHAMGHALAKTLAFLAFGHAAHEAGSRHLESLGGLARRMPRTSAAALMATLALAGLPLLSCFPGEWLAFQALILGYSAGAGELRLVAPFAGAGLALAGALAVAAFVKLYGIAFLGRPRSEAAAVAGEPPRGVTRALAAASALPLAFGLASPWVAASLGAPLALLVPGFDASGLAGDVLWTLRPGAGNASSTSPLAVAALIALFMALAWAWLRAATPRAIRRAPSWACGLRLEPQMQYSALGFTKPLRLIFEPVLRAESEREVLDEGSPYFARRERVREHVPPWIERALAEPFTHAVLWTTTQARRLQSGSVHAYLGYLLATLVALLLWAR